jgi:hypothetical protein
VNSYTPDPIPRWARFPQELPVQLTGEPLFQIRSVSLELGSLLATVGLSSGFITATAERVPVDVVHWHKDQGPDHRVTLSQLYSPVPSVEDSDPSRKD